MEYPVEDRCSEQFEYYGFTGYAIITLLQVMVFFLISCLFLVVGYTIIIASAGAPFFLLVWVVAILLIVTGVTGLVIALNYATTVALDSNGIWINYFVFWKRFIPWEDVKFLQYNNLGFRPNHVIVRYISPIHRLVGKPYEQSFNIVPGLKDSGDLFWEIRQRASRAQNREVPVEENWWN